MIAALELVGVEFTNVDQPGVRMRSPRGIAENVDRGLWSHLPNACHATFVREFYSGRLQYVRGFLDRSAPPGLATFNAPHRLA